MSFFATTVSSGRGVQQVTTGPLLFASALLKVIGNIGVHTLGAGLEVALQEMLYVEFSAKRCCAHTRAQWADFSPFIAFKPSPHPCIALI